MNDTVALRTTLTKKCEQNAYIYMCKTTRIFTFKYTSIFLYLGSNKKKALKIQS